MLEQHEGRAERGDHRQRKERASVTLDLDAEHGQVRADRARHRAQREARAQPHEAGREEQQGSDQLDHARADRSMPSVVKM
mgnify:CR=1 FL=1